MVASGSAQRSALSTPAQRAALSSVLAAAALVGVKLAVGLVTHSLALLAEALHSAVDVVAALITLFALRLAGRPADRSHPFGHGKAENLAALAEAASLFAASALIAYRAVSRIAGHGAAHASAPAYVFVVLGLVIAVDATRATVSWRVGRAQASPALSANAVHFASDLLGSVTVLIGLLFVSAGFRDGDSVAALVVAVLVVIAALRLVSRNAGVLMDAMPSGAETAARGAIAQITPPVRVRRLRLRQAAGRYFADVVVGVRPDAGVGQGHAVADAVERAVNEALPGSDVVVHVEPQASETLREQVAAAALSVRGVREIHNLRMFDVDGGTEVALHLKLPPDMTVSDAHRVASETESSIVEAVEAVRSVHTHIEPLSPGEAVRAAAPARSGRIENEVRALVCEVSGRAPLEVRVRETGEGLTLLLTLAVAPDASIGDAHARATEIEQRVRASQSGLADVVVHTEPTPEE